MIKRIVKLTFRQDAISGFQTIFDQSCEKIRGFDGCQHLELWQDVDAPEVFFTYSYWDSEAALNAYRHSALFQATWANTKKLFAAKPQAWSVQLKRQLP